MALFKCKMCGGDLEIAEGASVAECQYCGSKQTLPRFDSERKLNLYDRANHFRRNNEFDKAEGIYENILNDDPTDAEAYWSLVLCRYGIEYVEDPASHKRIPTVNRAQYTSVFADENYKKAIENAADTLQRELYEAEAKAIDEIQRGILEISEKEDPFDVFICYKETDAQGRRTPDSVLANELYHELTNEGFKVFFSRITLEDKLGTAYEPYIFAALHSAKVMVVLGTKPEYFNAVWVKNEWSRYLALIRSGEKKTLIPAYRDMDPYDLPEEFSHLQAQDMSKLGFMPDLVRGIRKIVEADKQKETLKETVVIQQSAGGTNLSAQLKRGMIALEDHDWNAADGFFDKALDMDAECAEAYFGKALAIAQCASGTDLVRQRLSIPVTESEMLTACEHDAKSMEKAVRDYTITGYLQEAAISSLFTYDDQIYESLTEAWKQRIAEETRYWERDRQMSRAVRYAKGGFSDTLQGLRNDIDTKLRKSLSDSEKSDEQAKERVTRKYAEKMEAAQEAAKEKYQAALKRRQADYDAYCKRQADASTEQEYAYAEERFRREGMRGFADCDERAEQCHAEAERLRVKDCAVAEAKSKAEAEERERQRIAAEKAAAAAKKKKATIGVIIVAVVVIAIAAALIVTKVIIPGKKYKQAEALLAAEDYDGAIAAFEALGSYKDSTERIEECKTAILDAEYDAAAALLEAGKYEEAISTFNALNGYKDSAEQIETCKTAILDAKYNAAAILLETGKYEEAISAFDALNGYKDSAEQIEACKTAIMDAGYDAASALLEAGKYEEAISAFDALSGFKDSAEKIDVCKTAIRDGEYEAAKALYDAGKYEEAFDAFYALGDYKDSADMIVAVEKRLISEAEVGTYVKLGSYMQNNLNENGTKDIIEWLVLDKTGNRALLISRYALDNQQFNTTKESITWERSTLREWLNNTFLNTAFSDKERTMIPSVTVSADVNPEYNTNPGNSTTDQLFLLSISEVNRYFSTDEAKMCKPTHYAIENGAFTQPSLKENKLVYTCYWWLRTPAYSSTTAATVTNDGSVDSKHISCLVNEDHAVRPAMWIDLRS